MFSFYILFLVSASLPSKDVLIVGLAFRISIPLGTLMQLFKRLALWLLVSQRHLPLRQARYRGPAIETFKI
jgi:hypothetical protein